MHVEATAERDLRVAAGAVWFVALVAGVASFLDFELMRSVAGRVSTSDWDALGYTESHPCIERRLPAGSWPDGGGLRSHSSVIPCADCSRKDSANGLLVGGRFCASISQIHPDRVLGGRLPDDVAERSAVVAGVRQ